MIRVFFDTETSGLPRGFGRPAEDLDAWGTARLVQLSWIVDQDGEWKGYGDLIIRPDGFEIPQDVSKIHGITQELALEKGVDCKKAVYAFLGVARMADLVIGHNVQFDLGVVGSELVRHWGKNYLHGVKTGDTMKNNKVVEWCNLPRGKWPKLMELYKMLFGEEFKGAHNSMMDVKATRECYWELTKRNIW